MAVIPLKRALYEARLFEAAPFQASGTLCGHIDFVGPFKGTCVLTPAEALAAIVVLQQAREDVLSNSDPLRDPRLIEARKGR